MWIDNGVPVYCEYSRGTSPSSTWPWAERLADLASKSGGMIIQAEDVPMMMPEEPSQPKAPRSGTTLTDALLMRGVVRKTGAHQPVGLRSLRPRSASLIAAGHGPGA